MDELRSFHGNQWENKPPKRKRWDMMVCEHCRKHKRTCPVCAGVI